MSLLSWLCCEMQWCAALQHYLQLLRAGHQQLQQQQRAAHATCPVASAATHAWPRLQLTHLLAICLACSFRSSHQLCDFCAVRLVAGERPGDLVVVQVELRAQAAHNAHLRVAGPERRLLHSGANNCCELSTATPRQVQHITWHLPRSLHHHLALQCAALTKARTSAVTSASGPPSLSPPTEQELSGT